MKRFFVVSGLLFFIVIIAAGVWAQLFLPAKIKTLIETEGSQALQGKVTVAQVSLKFWPPVSVVLTNLTAVTVQSGTKIGLHVKSIQSQTDLLSLLSKKVFLKNIITDLYVKTEFVETQVKAPQPQTASPSTPLEFAALPILFGTEVRLVNSTVHVQLSSSESVELQKINLLFSMPDLNQAWHLKTQAQMNWQGKPFPLSLPIEIDTPIVFDGKILKLSQAQFSVAGLKTTLSGQAELINKNQSWDIKLDMPDLKKLPIPPQLLPGKNWEGSFQGAIKANYSLQKNWTASGQIAMKGVKGDVDLDKNGTKVKGPLEMQLETGFQFEKNLKIDFLKSQGNFSQTAIDIPKTFTKPSGIELKFNADLSQAGEAFQIKNAEFRFHTLKIFSQGMLAPQGASKLEFKIPRVSLNGFEKFSPMLAKTPLQGQIEALISVSGDLSKPQELNVQANPIQLHGFRSSVSWESEDGKKKVQGLASVDLNARLQAWGPKLQSAFINLNTDLSQLGIHMGDLFEKKENSLLKLKISANQKKDLLQISGSSLETTAGRLELSGTVKNIQSPLLNLKLKTQRIDFAALAQLIPMLQTYKLNGTTQASLDLSGHYDMKLGIEKSPLFLKGSVGVNIPSFVYKSPATAPAQASAAKNTALAEKSKVESKVAVKPEPILPSWPITKNMMMQMKMKIGVIKYDDLVIQTLDGTASLQKGFFSGRFSVQDIFGGRVTAERVALNLLEAQPTVDIKAQTQNLDIARALAWATPEWKDLARGKLTGQLLMDVAHPSRADFVNATQVTGHAKLKEGYLSTLPFDQYVNQKLSKIPGVGAKNSMKTDGVNYDIDTDFVFKNAVLQFQKLNVLTPEKNELKSAGWVKVDKTMDLKGDAFIANPPVSGSFKEANSDNTGRLIVPVHFTGLVTNPELHLTDETIKKMIERTAQYEGQRLKKQAESQVRQEAQKQVDQQRKNLEDQAKKQLENLFGR